MAPTTSDANGSIVVLNGAPRAGKSSIARAIQSTFDGAWLNLGVDVYMRATPEWLQPGIGLRPGGERPDLEPWIVRMYGTLYDSVAAHARAGLNVVVDVGHHDSYSTPLGILPAAAQRLADHDVLFVGVRCPIDVIMERRGAAGVPVPAPVQRWQDAVHDPGIYDIELDTSRHTPDDGARAIRKHLDDGAPLTAFARLRSR